MAREANKSVEQELEGIWSELLRLEHVDVNDEFFAVGGDSLLAIQFIEEARQAGYNFTLKQFYRSSTIAALAEAYDTPTVEFDQSPVVGSVLIIPGQYRFLFVRETPDPNHWNVGGLFEVRKPVSTSVMHEAFRLVLTHHDALRIRFEQTEQGWQQYNGDIDDKIPFAVEDVSDLDQRQRSSMVERIASALQVGFDLTEGPLVKCVFFDYGMGVGRLLIIVHHLVIDAIGWRILIEDLEYCMRSILEGRKVILPPKTSSFMEWGKRLGGMAQDASLHKDLDYWISLNWQSASKLPLDFPEGLNTNGSGDIVSVNSSVKDTYRLSMAANDRYMRVDEVLLSALVYALTTWSGGRVMPVELMKHGRGALFEDVDLSRTIGYFITHAPLLVDVEQPVTFEKVCGAVKEQLRNMPNGGISYDLLKYMCADEDIRGRLEALPKAEVLFNYIGQTDRFSIKERREAILSSVKEPIGPLQSPQGLRYHPLGVRAKIETGRLNVVFVYSNNLHRRSTIESIASLFGEALKSYK